MSYQNAVEHLSSAIQLTAPAGQWPAFIADHYPELGRRTSCQSVGKHGWIYRWSGPQGNLPVAFVGHLHRGPVDQAGLKRWEHGPYEGHADQAYIYGCGAIAPLGHTVALLEAFEELCGQGVTPSRTIYLCLGDDPQADAEIASWFSSQGVILETVMGPGCYVQDGTPWDLGRPVAQVGMAELAAARMEMSFAGDGCRTAVQALAAYLSALDAHPCSIHPCATMEAQCDTMAGFTGGHLQALLMSRQLGPLANRMRGLDAAYALRIRSHVVPTEVRMDDGRAAVTLEVSLVAGETVDDTIRHLQQVAVLCDLPATPRLRVVVRPTLAAEATIQSPSYKLIADAYRDLNPAMIVMPQVDTAPCGLGVYQALAGDIYRFDPFWLSPDELASVAGPNERLQLASYRFGLDFYKALLTAQAGRDDVREALR